jgi:hypothetical protein
MLKTLFNRTSTSANVLTGMSDFAEMGDFGVTTNWTIKNWSVTVRPLDWARGGYERTMTGTGTVQYMNEMKDQLLASMGALELPPDRRRNPAQRAGNAFNIPFEQDRDEIDGN